ncbi:TonB C-terminal domain-containing protein [Desulforegula conservatrix]|uniref:TonB C-terminal domain-containing protein n=1 Tax=Desulforegula conservatrix TaxID=153026 RepID=UPI000422333B|nr:TonB C-terminal domain-containing protein [Desulforegula conservatrix]
MSDRSSMLNDTGDTSQFFVWGFVSVILHAFIVAGMFYLPELNIPEIKQTVITVDLSTMPSLEPPAKKKGALNPKASPNAEKPAAESGAPVEKEAPPPKGDIEKAPPPKPDPEPKKEAPPPPKEPQKPKPEPKVEEKKPKEVPKEDVISTKPKKEEKKEEKKEPEKEKPPEVKEDSKDAKKDAKDDKTPADKEPLDKESKEKDTKGKEPKKDGKVGEKDGSEKSDALARMRKKAALKAAASKAAGVGEGDGGEEGDPRGSEKGSVHGVEGGSEKGGVSASVADFYFYEIARYLGKNWIFADTVSNNKGLEALVILSVLPSGELKEPPLFKKRSGNSYFDDTVYRTIMKTVPFPGFPQGIKQDVMVGEFRFTPDGIK